FSVAPLLLVAIHIAGAVFGEEAARGEVSKQLHAVVGDDVAVNVEGMVKSAAEPHDTHWTPTVSILFLIIAALGAFLHIRGALCTIWELEPPAGNSWLGMLWDYALSLFMVFLTALMLLISLAVGLAIPLLKKSMPAQVVDQEFFWRWFEVGSSFFFLTVLFAASYRTLSGRRISWGY